MGFKFKVTSQEALFLSHGKWDYMLLVVRIVLAIQVFFFFLLLLVLDV